MHIFTEYLQQKRRLNNLKDYAFQLSFKLFLFLNNKQGT